MTQRDAVDRSCLGAAVLECPNRSVRSGNAYETGVVEGVSPVAVQQDEVEPPVLLSGAPRA